jgi:aminoglycoside 6'-N-acetyltransferase I
MSVKSMFIEHVTMGTEHFKKHGTIFFPEKNRGYTGSVNEHNEVCNKITISEDQESIEMRNFQIEDMDMCVELYRKVFSANPWNDGWLSNEQVMDYLKELVENPVFEGFVAYQKSDVVAACFGHKRSWWTGKDFFIDELFVAEEMQGIGIGSKLLEYVETNYAIYDCMRLILLTNKDLPAEKFYLKKGFKINENRISLSKRL